MRKIFIIILGALLVINGIMLIVRPVAAFSMLGYFMASAFLINGIANIIIWFKLRKIGKPSVWYLVSSIISVIFAFALFGDVYFKLAAEIALVYITAIWFFITGVMRIILSLNLKKEDQANWWFILILGILLCLCGVVSIANPIALMFAIGLNLAINMVFCGIDLITIASLF